MKSRILIIHRDYRLRGGEDVFLDTLLLPALEKLPVDTELVRFQPLFKGSKILDLLEIVFMTLGLERLRPSYFFVKRVLKSESFTHCLFNNFIPTISLELPQLMKKQGIKTFSWVHNQRLACANGLNFNGKEVCRRCVEQGSRFAFIQRCHPSRLQSLIYAFVYRKKRVVRKLARSVDCFVGPSQYSLNTVSDPIDTLQGRKPDVRLIRFPASIELPGRRSAEADWTKRLRRPFYLFVGRVSYEKGADLFFELARKYPQYDFVLGGEGPMLKDLLSNAPANLICPGFLKMDEKLWLYERCEALIVPSRVPENAGLVIHESHLFGTPVVYPRGGGAEETVRWLGRDGCAFDEFVCQKFSRRKVNVQALPTFSDQLFNLLFGT